MQGTYYLGVDIGTTSTKAVLFSQSGKVVSSHYCEYPLLTPTPLIAEQDPNLIFNAVIKAIKAAICKSAVKKEQLAFISFSSAMHSVMAVNKDGQPLTNSITWADSRSAPWSEKIKTEMNGHDIYRRTGTPIHPMSPLSKITWLRYEQPDIFECTYKFISIKEFVFYKLFNKFVVDYSIASATGMFNLNSLDWDDEALRIAGITKKQLSDIVSTTYSLTGMKREYANYMDFLSTTPFIIGASDGVLSNVGMNAIDKGVVAMTIGTSGAIRAVVDEPITDPEGRFFCYALTDKHWVIGGPVNNGGIILRWVREQFANAEVEKAVCSTNQDPYDVLSDLALQIAPGSDGLLFLPYLSGERAPLWDANARGTFFGLGLHHNKEHMIRAVFEGVVLNLYHVRNTLQAYIGTPTKLLATGGFARSKLWRQMVADIFNQEVQVPESFESSCLGAVILGMYAVGDIPSLKEASAFIGTTNSHIPIDEHVKVYQELIPIYINVSAQLQDQYEQIASFQQKWIQ
ncbi:gluconokinase [Bacillus sp. HMF5848]|uniref:gluconokinase n=1 Tax=Bacillus sp. HMF5848 TaxID=2495421 RepID=UPI000F7B2D23|nr:gluconokinase [Bacillus sp. HMF5848]RSK25950.1 gluconokinase [Bacillus sp. HMF5848]